MKGVEQPTDSIETTDGPVIEVIWTTSLEPDPAGYRRLLEILFATRIEPLVERAS